MTSDAIDDHDSAGFPCIPTAKPKSPWVAKTLFTPSRMPSSAPSKLEYAAASRGNAPSGMLNFHAD